MQSGGWEAVNPTSHVIGTPALFKTPASWLFEALISATIAAGVLGLRAIAIKLSLNAITAICPPPLAASITPTSTARATSFVFAPELAKFF